MIEWDTDESSNSEGSYGVDENDLEDFTSSGENVVAHKLTFTDLDPGTSYSYQIGSTDPSGNGATESAIAVFTTDPELDLTQPQIVDGPDESYVNDRSATISWELDEESSGEVEFGTTEELGFIRSVPTTSDEQEITLSNLEPSTTYYYQVSSFDLSNNGPVQSSIEQFITDAEADITAPEIDNVDFATADESAVITWTTNELSDSFIEFGTNSELLDLNVGNANDVTQHELTLTNLTPDTQYFLRVGSVDRSDNISEFEVVGGITTEAAPDMTAPAIPTNLFVVQPARSRPF